MRKNLHPSIAKWWNLSLVIFMTRYFRFLFLFSFFSRFLFLLFLSFPLPLLYPSVLPRLSSSSKQKDINISKKMIAGIAQGRRLTEDVVRAKILKGIHSSTDALDGLVCSIPPPPPLFSLCFSPFFFLCSLLFSCLFCTLFSCYLVCYLVFLSVFIIKKLNI